MHWCAREGLCHLGLRVRETSKEQLLVGFTDVLCLKHAFTHARASTHALIGGRGCMNDTLVVNNAGCPVLR